MQPPPTALTRDNVTVASRIMLPAYVVLAMTFGLVYIFDPGNRVAVTPALSFQRQVLPMWVWGLLFLALAAVMLAAFSTRSRMTMAFGLACCAVTWLMWGGMYAVSVADDPTTSLLTPVPPCFVTAACVASMASLLQGEV